MSHPKNGHLESPTYLGWIRRQPCAFCAAPAPSQAHHFPGKGRSGTTRDDLTVPVCAECHRRCEGATSTGGEYIAGHGWAYAPGVPVSLSDERQAVAVASSWAHFKATSTLAEWEQVSREILRWKESRIFSEVPF